MRLSALCSNHKTSSVNPGGFIQLTAKPQKYLGIAAVASAAGWCSHCKEQGEQGEPGEEGRGLPLGSWAGTEPKEPSNMLLLESNRRHLYR